MREYDAQIGRFFRVDPIAENFYYLTPYQYASNDPILNIDLDGLEGISINDCPTCAVQKEKVSRESSAIKPKLAPGARIANQQPSLSFSISRGKQVGIKVGSIGAEYNAGSKELVKLQNDKPLTNVADDKTTKQGYAIQAGVVNIGKDIEQKTETVTDPITKLPVEKTTSQVTNAGSVGLKGGMQLGVERQQTIEQYGPQTIATPVITANSGLRPVIGWSRASESGGSVRGMEFSVSLYLKIEIKVDVLGTLNAYGFY